MEAGTWPTIPRRSSPRPRKSTRKFYRQDNTDLLLHKRNFFLVIKLLTKVSNISEAFVQYGKTSRDDTASDGFITTIHPRIPP